MRLQAAIEGDLQKIMRDELEDAAGGVRRGVERATTLAKTRLRSEIRRAGLKGRGRGGRLEKTWQSKFYGNNQDFLTKGVVKPPAGLVFSKAPHIITAHTEGALIKSTRGRFLAIPTEWTPRTGRGRAPISPADWPSGLPKLIFLPAGRGGVLVARGYTLTKAGRISQAKNPRARDVVVFVLVPSVRLRPRLEKPEVIGERVMAILPDLILRNYRSR